MGKEVSPQTASLLLDSLEQRGFDPAKVWADLPVSVARLRSRSERLDWEVWVDMARRAEEACGGPEAMTQLFVRGAGARTGHPFVRLANAFFSLEDVYALFARWGVNRSLMMRGRFERGRGREANFEVRIDDDRLGSAATLRFIVGVLRHLPSLQGLADAEVTVVSLTPRSGVYRLVLPRRTSLRARARMVLSLLTGARATLDELAEQSQEINEKNIELEQQLAELRRTTDALRERDEWLGLAIDAGRIGIWRWDVARRTLKWSAGVALILGLPDVGESEAEAWIAAIHPDDRGRVAESMLDAGARGLIDVEYRVLRAGETRWLRSRGRVLRDDDGAPRYALGTVADITEQRQLEGRLRLADRLISAGTLAAGVAHEINNPLAYVLGNVELMRLAVDDDPAAAVRFGRSLADMADGLERIRSIVRDLRTFARPEQSDVRAVDPRDVCDAAIRIVTPVVRHRARVETDYAADTPHVEANESRLGQVIVNLVLNASHAMPEDRSATEGVIRVRTRAVDRAAVIDVEDNGVGIPPEVLPRIFDPFFTTKGSADGTGLGLSICHGIVASLGGRIDVDSARDRGTRFTITLSRANAAPSAPPPAVVTKPARGRVLVVDDEDAVRRTVCLLLRRAGWTVDEAATGRAALDAIAKDGAYQAILCDVMMPDVSGIDVFATLERERPEAARRVVFLSGGAMTDRARALLARPDVHVVEKPFQAGELVAAIARVSS